MSKRLRSKDDLANKPSGHGKGRWQSRTVLWKARQKAKRKRAVAQGSRGRNRA